MKLVLRTKKTVGKSPLFSRINVEGSARWVSLRINVDIKEWQDVSKSERKLANYLTKKGISKKIALIEEAIADMRFHHRLTKESLDRVIENVVLADKREELDRVEQLKKKIEQKKKSNVKNFVIEHIENIVNGVARTVKKERYSKEACKNWLQFKRVFLDFYSLRPFIWDDINELLVDRYIAYLESLDYSKNTIDKHVRLFKTLVRTANRLGLHTNQMALSEIKSVQVRDSDMTSKIYLSVEEINALYAMELSGKEEIYRDWFLISCFSALRFSDYSTLDKTNFDTTANGTKVIRLYQQKTKSQVVIPCLDDRLEILLKKYDYKVPKITNQKMNKGIKRVCKKLAETVPSLNELVSTLLTKTEKGLDLEIAKRERSIEYDKDGNSYKRRWGLVCCHSARRTCITNMYLSHKYPTNLMMSLSGHKTEAMFYKYVKASLDEKADELANIVNNGNMF